MPSLTPPKEADKVLQVAEYFIRKDQDGSEKNLDSKKLQKLIYYAQAWNLVLHKKELFSDQIEAWIHGPAIYKVWNTFKTFDFGAEHPEIKQESFSLLNTEDREVLDTIWNVYGKFDSEYLEALTHSELPWQEARKGLQESERSKNVITPESLTSYYGQRLAEANERGSE